MPAGATAGNAEGRREDKRRISGVQDAAAASAQFRSAAAKGTKAGCQSPETAPKTLRPDAGADGAMPNKSCDADNAGNANTSDSPALRQARGNLVMPLV